MLGGRVERVLDAGVPYVDGVPIARGLFDEAPSGQPSASIAPGGGGGASRGVLSFADPDAGPTGSRRVTGDLFAYAPGLNTTARDLRAVLAAEVRPPRRGDVDAGARALIDAARPPAWSQVRLRDAGATVRLNGRGLFAAERVLPGGLRERITSDGTFLVHAYPELGVAARRRVAPAYHGVLRDLVPWALPAPEALARDADVVRLDDRTVAVVPDAEGAPTEELVFAPDGRLAARRWRRDGDVLASEAYAAPDADGRVVVVRRDAEGVEVTRTTVEVGSASPLPLEDLRPDAELVVLPLPFRAGAAVKAGRAAGLAAGLANPPLALQVAIKRYLLAGDRRLGVYTCLAAAGAEWDPRDGRTWVPGVTVSPAADHPESPLARYLQQQRLYERGDFLPPAGLRHAAPGSFLERLSVFRHLWARWTRSGGALVHADAELDHLVRFCREGELPAHAWALVDLLAWSPVDPPGRLRRVAAACAALADAPGVGERAALERTRLLLTLGERAAARGSFLAVHARARAAGRLLPLEPDLRLLLGDDWPAWSEDVAAELVAAERRPLAVVFAWQVDRLGDRDLAARLRAAALDGADAATRRFAADLGLRYLEAAGAPGRAGGLLAAALAADPERAADPA